MLTYEKMFKILESKGIDQIDVVFSGGNDSGSIENFVVHVYSEEKEMKEDEINKINPDLSDVLSSVVYNDYGSFAGDYDVSGKYVFSVKDKTVKKECSESYTEYKQIDEIVMDEESIKIQNSSVKDRPTIPESWERKEFNDVNKEEFNYGKSLVVCKTCNKPRSIESLSVEKVYCGNDCDKVYPTSNFYYIDKLSYNFNDETVWDNEIDSVDSLKLYMKKHQVR
jgi:hypothetical protein